jgi:hypothetical protein
MMVILTPAAVNPGPLAKHWLTQSQDNILSSTTSLWKPLLLAFHRLCDTYPALNDTIALWQQHTKSKSTVTQVNYTQWASALEPEKLAPTDFGS